MRTNIEIDNKRMQKAMRYGDFRTKKESVDAALKILSTGCAPYQNVLSLAGKVEFDAAYGYKARHTGRKI